MSIYRQGPRPANTCPRCGESLIVTRERADVRCCERCGGVFAGNEASERIVTKIDRGLREIGFQAALGKAPRADRGEPIITCPECLVAMQKIRIDSAACSIDACPAHGTWFDVGELEDVMTAFANARRKGVRLLATEPSPQGSAKPASPDDDDEVHPAGAIRLLRDFVIAALKGAASSWWRDR